MENRQPVDFAKTPMPVVPLAPQTPIALMGKCVLTHTKHSVEESQHVLTLLLALLQRRGLQYGAVNCGRRPGRPWQNEDFCTILMRPSILAVSSSDSERGHLLHTNATSIV